MLQVARVEWRGGGPSKRVEHVAFPETLCMAPYATQRVAQVVHTHMHTYTHAYTYTRTRTRPPTCAHTSPRTRTYTYIHIHREIHINVSHT